MQRKYINKSFKVTTWDKLKPYYDELLERTIKNSDELIKWLKDRSEVESVVNEEQAWRYIKMTCDTENETIRNRYYNFIQNIELKVASFTDQLNKKVIENLNLLTLQKYPGYDIMIREIKKDMYIFREENVSLFAEIDTKSSTYGKISGAMSITLNGEELTLQHARVELKNPDRNHREKVYQLISKRKLEDKAELNSLFEQLIVLRHQLAINAGFNNYRDYQFKFLGRFDYTHQDCLNMHEAVQAEVMPVINQLAVRRQRKLNIAQLKPWDLSVDPDNRKPLQAFKTAKELLNKTIHCLNQVDPFFGDCLKQMDEMERLDLESRKGKAPGGYNYPLPESEIPFISMNATSTVRDVITLIHESGHAVHAFLSAPLELINFKNYPAEVAELASMSMELISMDEWDIFFGNEEELNRAKREYLEGIFNLLSGASAMDKFQHWVYENPEHSQKQREAAWTEINSNFSDSITNWDGLDEVRKTSWQGVLHIYQMPFYMIEYSMAQLGAIAIWKNYKKDKEKALHDYKEALKLGYTKTIPEIYEAASIQFNFSRAYIRELIRFVEAEIDSLS